MSENQINNSVEAVCPKCKKPVPHREAILYNGRHEDCWTPRTKGNGTLKVVTMSVSIPKPKHYD